MGHWPKVEIREGLLKEVPFGPGWEEFVWKFNLTTGTGKSVCLPRNRMCEEPVTEAGEAVCSFQ